MKSLFIPLMLGLLNINVNAQSPSPLIYDIKGIIQDSSDSKPLDYCTIGLKSDKNIPVKSLLTNPDGSFLISNIPQGKYSITVVSVGYQAKSIQLELNDSVNRKKDLGIIYLRSKSTRLKEVTVTATKPLVKQEVDRITYDLQADPESKSSNVLEMMRKVPFVSVDGDDNILLKGNSGYKILINGKPSGMVERNPKELLRSMPASSIQSIEVITNPPAKYDAEGLVGIINIITNKKIDNGYNGSINLGQRFPAGGPGTGGAFTLKTGKLGLSSFAGVSASNSPQTSSDSRRTTTGSNTTHLTQMGTRKSEGNSGYFGSELSYEIDSLNLISAQFNINGNRSNGSATQTSVLNGDTGLLQGYKIGNDNSVHGTGLDASLNYQLGFKKSKNRLLTFSYKYYSHENIQNSGLTTTDRFNFEIPDYNQFNNGGASEQTFQLDYVHPVKKLTIEAGVKGILRTNKSDFEYQSFNVTNQKFELDATRSNRFENQQNVLGAYNSYQYSLKQWGFKAGLRVERTAINIQTASAADKTQQHYLNVLPSVNINRSFSDRSSLNLGFSQRIQRPGIYQLNPFVDRSNPNFESTGNPNLHPTTNNMFQLGYSKSKKGFFNFMVGYMLFNDLIMPVSVTDPVTLITQSSFDNTGKARAIITNFNINYPVNTLLNMSLNGGIGHGRVEGLVNGKMVENQGFMYHISSSAGYRLGKEWRTNASLNVHGPNLSIQGTSKPFMSTTFSVNKDLIKDKLSFSAAANNPFAKYRTNHSETFGPDFLQEINSQTYYRSFNTSLNYRFGKLKESIKKNRRGIRNDDVSTGSGL